MYIDPAPTKACKSVIMYLTSHEGPQLWFNIINCARITHLDLKSIEESRCTNGYTNRKTALNLLISIDVANADVLSTLK